jgi:hypothetical protein
VDEVFSLDQPIPESLGLIFLFKWRRETDDRPVTDPEALPDLFFAKQVLVLAYKLMDVESFASWCMSFL